MSVRVGKNMFLGKLTLILGNLGLVSRVRERPLVYEAHFRTSKESFRSKRSIFEPFESEF